MTGEGNVSTTTTTLADLLGAEAAPVEFEHDGETYKVTLVTHEVETRIARLLRADAYAKLYAERDLMPPEMYEDSLRVLQDDREKHVFLGPGFWKMLRSKEGHAGLVAVLLQTTKAKATKLLDERGPEVTALVVETILASVPRESAENIRKALRGRAAAADDDDAAAAVPTAQGDGSAAADPPGPA